MITYDYEADEFLPAKTVESWTEADGLPAGTVAWSVFDDSMDYNPHADSHLSQFVDVSGRYAYNDDGDFKNLVEELDHIGLSNDEIKAVVKMRFGAQAVETFDFGDHGQGTMWAYIAVTITELLGDPKYYNPVSWLLEAERVDELAAERLASEIAEFTLWDEGNVFSVHAANLATGETADLYNIIEGYPHKYLWSVALELAAEVTR